MPSQYKHLCIRCKKNYVLSSWSNKYPMCYDCQKTELNGTISNTKMKKMFDIPEEFYVSNSFLRDIKVKYLRFGNLSDKQIEAFKKTVANLLKENQSRKK